MSLITRNKPTEATPEAIAKARGYAAMASQPGMQFDVQGRTVIQLADTLALVNGALTEAESAFRAEQAEKVTEQNRADRVTVELDALKATIPAPGKESRTIILTRSAGGYWDVIENGKYVDQLGDDEALFVLAHRITGGKAPPYGQNGRSFSDSYAQGRRSGIDYAKREAKHEVEDDAVAASFGVSPEPVTVEKTDPSTTYHPDIVLPNGQGVDFKTGKASPEGNTSQNQLYRSMAEEAGATWSEKPARIGIEADEVQTAAVKTDKPSIGPAMIDLVYLSADGYANHYDLSHWMYHGHTRATAIHLRRVSMAIADLMNEGKPA